MNRNAVILIAEDDSGHYELVKRNLWLSCVESEILHFKDGQELLDFLFMTGPGPKREPRGSYILLLDIRMPKVDGREVLRCIKQDVRLRDIPVIMLTTTGNEKEISLCYELGCSFYMVKPVDYNKFMEAVGNLGKFLSMKGLRIPNIMD
jgi:CheY-like chemotaxis protein